MTGGCHCGRVRFEVDGAPATVLVCNCSVCTKKGYLHWIVPRAAFRQTAGEADLATYTFNTGVAQHHFCKVCGCSPFSEGLGPNGPAVAINLRCVEGIDLAKIRIAPYDGASR